MYNHFTKTEEIIVAQCYACKHWNITRGKKYLCKRCEHWQKTTGYNFQGFSQMDDAQEFVRLKNEHQ